MDEMWINRRDGYTNCTKRSGVVDEIHTFGKRDCRMAVARL